MFFSAQTVREAQELSSSPSADYTATPLETDLFEWHFTLRGPPNSVYSEGIYHGRIVLPPTYPLRPPSFRFVTPSGRFEANREICLSISGHHEETWQPAWGVRTALVALRSFMETDPRGQLGGLDTTDAVRRGLAAESGVFRCGACGKTNAEIMQLCEEAAAAASEEEKRRAAQVEVPAELKMGWRDEMQKKADDAAPGADPESAQLAEGFVQTVPVSSSGSEVAPLPVPALPAQGVPQPTRTVPLPSPRDVGSPVPQPPVAFPAAVPQAQAYRQSDDAVPLWIDRTIVIICIVLAAMLLKMLAGA